MPQNSDFYQNGLKKWDVTNYPKSNSLQGSYIHKDADNIIQLDLGCRIKTNILNQSFKIENPVNTSEVLGHFENSEVTGWEVQGNLLLIISSDELPIILVFPSPGEVVIAEDRLYQILNGANLTTCP